VRGPHPVLDSLGDNAYGMYIIHYTFVLWIQYALLSATWPAWVKFGVAFVGGLALSWGTSKLLRQIPIVRRVL
jgi:peptidoglycan/LPS O-acetylase OafA/YrhL